MRLIVKQNRAVSKEYRDNEGTQYENNATTLIFDIPEVLEGYETADLNKYILFDIDSPNNRDILTENNTYIVGQNITQLGTVDCNLLLMERSTSTDTTNLFKWASEKITLNFNDGITYGQEIIPQASIDIINSLITKVENLNITHSKTGKVLTITFTDKEGEESTETLSDGNDGTDGTDGTTFTPSVSNEGIISWTNDGGKQNPESKNIKGPIGPTGDSGVYVGTTEPIDPAKNVWIDTDGEPDYNILFKTDVINDVLHTTIDKPLSANMGKELNDRIDNLSARGRFLSNWNMTTGLPITNPVSSGAYEYRTGDYYIVSVVGTTNYKPNGSSYTTGIASTTVETSTVMVGDTYRYDGTNWILEINTERTTTFANISGQPSDNSNLSSALNSKVNTSQVKTELSTTAGDVYDVRYINSMIGNIETLLGGI